MPFWYKLLIDDNYDFKMKKDEKKEENESHCEQKISLMNILKRNLDIEFCS